MKSGAESEKILFDFRVATHSPAWEVVNDDVMGGVSMSQFQVLTNGSAVFSGMISLENNGGFASVRSPSVRENLTGLSAFVIRVCGDGRNYRFTVRTSPGFDAPLYQCNLKTKHDEWQEHRLLFKEFVPTFRGRVLTELPLLNPTRDTSIGFLISGKQAGPFRLEIGWLKASTAT